ncbi:MAG TPA: SDR family oxidoreductase, partial [Kofleriaceae bacterium]
MSTVVDNGAKMQLSGKIAFITGGTSGIGLATAARFVAEGARVAIFGRPGPRLEAARVHGLAFAGDVRCSADLATALASTREQLGPIDVLVCAAGVSNAPAIGELTDAHYDDLMDTNCRGTVFAVRHALPRLANDAAIVVVGSVGGAKGQPGDALYAGSKGFVRAFARSAGTDPELLRRGIRVNCVSPGPIDTPLTHEAT